MSKILSISKCVTLCTIEIYYFAGAQRVAALAPDASTGVRERYPQGFGADKVSYLLSDHPFATLTSGVGSTSITADADGNLLSRTLYSGLRTGEIRHQAGALPTPAATPTNVPAVHAVGTSTPC